MTTKERSAENKKRAEELAVKTKASLKEQNLKGKVEIVPVLFQVVVTGTDGNEIKFLK